MKKQFIFFTLIIVLMIGCQAWLKKLQDTVDDAVSDVTTDNVIDDFNNSVDDALDSTVNEQVEKLGEELEKLIEEAKTEIENSYNVTDFHYSISFGDNSTLYENKENYENLKSFSYYLLDADAPDVVQARNYNSAGEVFFVTNRYEAAERSFKKSLEIYENLNYFDSTEAILTMSNLGLLYQTMGKYSLSEEYTLKALKHRENNSEDTIGYAAALNNLGVLYKIQGQFTKSENYLNRALEYIEDKIGTDNMQYSIVLNNQAMLYQIINKTEKAEELMQKSLEVAKKNVKEKSSTYSRLKVNLALLYQAQGKYSKAEQIYKDAIEQKKKRLGKNHPDYAMLLRNLSSLYMEMERYNNVEPLLIEALEVYQKKFGVDNPQYAKTKFQLGVYNQKTENYDKAEGLFEHALDIQNSVLDEHHKDIFNTYEYLAINYWHKKNHQKALLNFQKALDGYIYIVNTYFETMSDAEKTKFWNEIHPSFIRFYSFIAENYKKIPQSSKIAYNYHIQTKALLLNSSRKVKNRILSSNNNDLIEKYNQWVDLKNYTAKLYGLSNQELAERNINLDSIIEVSENLEKEIASMSSDFKLASEQKSIKYEDIKNELDDDEIAIEILRVDRYDYSDLNDMVSYVALIVDSEKEQPEIVVLEDGLSLETINAKEYSNSIMNGKNMMAFYDYYWASIDEKMNNNKEIFLSVDGIYNRINVNTFMMPDSSYVIDNYSIYYLTNSKDLISLKKHIGKEINLKNKTADLIGFPNYSKDMPEGYEYVPPLPGTKKEVNNIKNILTDNNWQIKTYLANQANESNLKNISNPYVLHIATHGYFLEGDSSNTNNARSFGVSPERAFQNPLLRSGLLLTGADKTILNINDKDNASINDGILNAYEAMVMQLDKTQLVILSACQTGLGDIKTGEGVYGLQRAFQIAGTQTIVTSLWEVSDEGTQELMSAFYENWLKTGDEYQAFRNARLHIKDKFKYPYFWGAFILVGK